MDMVKRGILPESKHLFSQLWGNLWDLPGKYNKVSFREVSETRKSGKQSMDIETSRGQLYRK